MLRALPLDSPVTEELTAADVQRDAALIPDLTADLSEEFSLSNP